MSEPVAGGSPRTVRRGYVYCPIAAYRPRSTVTAPKESGQPHQIEIGVGPNVVAGWTFLDANYCAEILRRDLKIVGWEMQAEGDQTRRYVVGPNGEWKPGDEILGETLEVGYSHRPVFDLDPDTARVALFLWPEVDLTNPASREYWPMMICGAEVASSQIANADRNARQVSVRFGKDRRQALTGFTFAAKGEERSFTAIRVNGHTGWQGNNGNFRINEERRFVPWELSPSELLAVQVLQSKGRPVFSILGEYGDDLGKPCGEVLFFLDYHIPIE